MAIEAGILSSIGKTPLVGLNKLFPAASPLFYAKLEMCNPGGSIKDRSALLMLSKAFEEGKLEPNSTVIESSSGNMAIGLAPSGWLVDWLLMDVFYKIIIGGIAGVVCGKFSGYLLLKSPIKKT